MKSIASFLKRLDGFVQPPGAAASAGGLEDAGRFIYAAVAVALTGALALIPVFFALGEPIAGWLTVVSLLVYMASMAVLVFTGSIRRTVLVGTWAGMIVIVAVHVVLGGYAWSGGFVLWGIANCVLAAIWLDRRNTYLLVAAYGIAGLALAFLESAIQSMRTRPDPMIALIVVGGIFVTTLLITAPLVHLLLNRVSEERARARSLLLNVLPESIADRLQVSSGWIADSYDDATVLFGDLVGFTQHAHESSPEQVLAELNTVFSRFDSLVQTHKGEKIKTIGDGYMAAFGVPEPIDEHACSACQLAIDMLSSLDEINSLLGTDFGIRVGISSGPSIGGVIGTRRFSYDLWGDNVNLASRLEGAAQPGQILVSESVVSAASHRFRFEPCGLIELKGMPSTRVFSLVSR